MVTDKGTLRMVVSVIGVLALVASVSSWFPPGIAVGLGLIVLGVAISSTPGRNP